MLGKYDENLAIELLYYGNELNLSDGEISKLQSEDSYCYRGEACLTMESVENLG